MSLTILFQLTFTYIYSTFSKKFSVFSLKLDFLKKWGFQKMRYETEFFEKTKCLASTYKSDGLSDKLSKKTKCVCIYIYKGVYFILSINFFLIIIIIIIASC